MRLRSVGCLPNIEEMGTEGKSARCRKQKTLKGAREGAGEQAERKARGLGYRNSQKQEIDKEDEQGPGRGE